MTIDFKSVSKRYTEEWILRNITYQFDSDIVYGIEGSNGSGKSTLIKLISGYLSPTVGAIQYSLDGKIINKENIYTHCSLWGPHVSLISELTIDEMVKYFIKFKPLRSGMSQANFYKLANLPVKTNRLIKSLSSGQAQRLGLALTILSNSDILLLDEPGAFLDEKSLDWLYSLISDHNSDRLMIISSNEEKDLILTSERLKIEDYK